MSDVLGKVTKSMSSMTTALRGKLHSKGAKRDADMQYLVLLAIAVFILTTPLELGHLEFAVLGALFYAGLQASRNMTRNRLANPKLANSKRLSAGPHREDKGKRYTQDRRVATLDRKQDAHRDTHPAGKQDYRQVSVQPVSVPSFGADGFEAQVDELLDQVRPSREGTALVQDISLAVKKAIGTWLPEAEVIGFSSGDVLRGTAFAVAIPEVEIVLSVTSDVITQCLGKRASRPIPEALKLDPRKLQKSMLRACTDELASTEIFKFRRSAFKGQEPKVTLVAQVNGKSIPIDFSVNAVTPLNNAALLAECGQIDPRTRDLILLVRRWAKDRGVSHAAKGHLPPYAWTLLTIYFLQVRESQTPLLPKLASFKRSSEFLHKQQKQFIEDNINSNCVPGGLPNAATPTVAALFEEFLRFYARSFNWRNEAVSVRAACREPPTRSLPLQIVTMEDGSTAVAPSVEDPFNPRHNVSNCMTGVSLRRLKEEFARGDHLASRHAPLIDLIEPWAPPEFSASAPASVKRVDDE